MTRARKPGKPPSNEVVQRVLDLLFDFGAVRARAMFGGFGIYCDDVMFALVAWDHLYIKTDEHNRNAFEAVGSSPFVYRNGLRPPVTMSYWSVPDGGMDNPDALRPWARLGVEAARRSKAPRRPG